VRAGRSRPIENPMTSSGIEPAIFRFVALVPQPTTTFEYDTTEDDGEFIIDI
jgi:hypothetical protein